MLEFVINGWGNWIYMYVFIYEREENSYFNGRLLKGRVLGV